MAESEHDEGISEFLSDCPNADAVRNLIQQLGKQGFLVKRDYREDEQSRKLKVLFEHRGVQHDKIQIVYNLPGHRRHSGVLKFRIQFMAMKFPFHTIESHKRLAETFERITNIELDPTTNWMTGRPKLRSSPLTPEVLPRFLSFLDWWRDEICSGGRAPVLFAEEVSNAGHFVEGAIRTVTVNSYERDQTARRFCIDHHGTICRVCGLDFESMYGEIGRGFIHVHHNKPLASLGREYIVDPINDLVPVCPNCHAMLHQKSPPFTIDELKKILRPPSLSGDLR